MDQTVLEEITLIGVSLERKTTNANGQSQIDCGSLWQKFENEKYADKIPGKEGDATIAVYHEYEGDHTQPFSYFIGFKVKKGTAVPEGLEPLIIPAGTYQKIVSRGQMPDCIANTWKEIWVSGIPRSYQADFEVYDERSRDWGHAEVDIYLSVKQ